jgi:hypothetical protein
MGHDIDIYGASELTQYYRAFEADAHMSAEEPATCRCRGGGWLLSDVDTWHACPRHYSGQPHPEDDI